MKIRKGLAVATASGMALLAAMPALSEPTGPTGFRVARGTSCPPGYAYRKSEAQQAEFVCEALPAATESKPGWPVPVPLSRFGTTARDPAPLGEPLTAQDEKRLLAAAATFDLPAYVYSGCHDRAHAAYLLLPEDLRGKVMKVWLIAPKIYTPGVGGFISLASGPEGLPNVKWGYHVALAYVGPKGMKLLDPSLAPGASLTLQGWFKKLRYPSLTFWTLTDGSTYLFFPEESKDVFFKNKEGVLIEKNMAFLRNKGIWGGNSFPYEGPSRDEAYIPVALARDEVGLRGLKGEGCNTVRALAVEPADLLDFLGKGGSAECAGEVALFQQRTTHWRDRLH